MTNNPLSVFETEIETFKSQFAGNSGDWKLLCNYLLMPILDVDSINDMQITDKQRNRLYHLLKKNAAPLRQLLQTIGYSCFFTELESFHGGNPSYQSRHRPMLIGDDTKQAKPEAKLMEYLSLLFCPTEGRKLPCYNVVVIFATFGDKQGEILLDLQLWLPKRHPQHKSKPKMLVGMIQALETEAKARNLSFEGVFFSCDAAYQRSNALMEAVVDVKLTLLAKVSGNLTFTVKRKGRKAKNIRKYTPRKQMKSCSRLGVNYRYKRIIAKHPTLGEVLLILSARYDEKHQKWRRIILITNDLALSSPRAIVLYSRRWRVEVFFKSMKQQMRMGTFQLRRFKSIQSHFQLRGLAYLLLSIVRRAAFRHQKRWSLRQVKRWFTTRLIMAKAT
jgi:hypothetical protein